ncbi:cell wall hydrolase [Brevundimonas variabilis]|uniref:Spore germination cell wall hydrolase CwlJ-like protein n=1 Tax=Brevundimonas variabilis TaxID=74312 RepID=A0A7W9FDB4_9CAUL|nr:cell wall hydrolase [Brevundimonas variabilis]MBB5745060.1 spore germination cell wall hydrolase CwlJ-like protein [Brevundimonas variabilis]
MITLDWAGLKSRCRHFAAAAPALVAALGVGMAAGSTTRSDDDLRAEAVARVTGGDFGSVGLTALLARFDPAQRALAARHDPEGAVAPYGLTPGWESLTLAGKPILELGASGLDARKRNASMPTATGALQPARPFVFKAATEADRRRALRCLSQAVYYEAALESTQGQEAVAQVILNRVRDPNYPNTICGVVFQGAERSTGCQFSFTCDGALSQPPVAWAWDRASSVAERALAGHVAARVGTATHYHADYVSPWWSPTLAKIDQIGAHIFYRWKGVYGETAAFRQAYAGREPVIDEARFSKPRIMLAGVTDPAPATSEGDATMKSVEIDGQTRVVGIASLGGRRQPTATDIAAINARLKAFEEPQAVAPAITTVPVQGAVPMDVEEVGRPVS